MPPAMTPSSATVQSPLFTAAKTFWVSGPETGAEGRRDQGEDPLGHVAPARR